LSWSEFFRTQHRVYKIEQQTRANCQRNNRIEHFSYLNPLQNLTYSAPKTKNATVATEKIVSNMVLQCSLFTFLPEWVRAPRREPSLTNESGLSP
jgi:hypothetical protein